MCLGWGEVVGRVADNGLQSSCNAAGSEARRHMGSGTHLSSPPLLRCFMVVPALCM